MHTEAREDSVSIAINDTGPGVPLEYRERVFDKFFRIEHHREGRCGRSGIGLYVAREIVPAHSGRLRCDDSG